MNLVLDSKLDRRKGYEVLVEVSWITLLKARWLPPQAG
jgi:hypothetical protein